ncbi:MAG TPA: outer membrane beta-barrel family protein [Chitinophagaceae bacterium]
MKKLIHQFFLLSLLAQSANAQEIPILIKVSNTKNEPVAFASITVTNRADSLQSFKKIADSSGKAFFNLQKNEQYSVNISSVNNQPIEKGISTSSGQTTFSFTAEPLPKALSGVVIRSQKPLIRQEDDKTIVDPENLVASSTSGYEVLEKTPGLFVDQDGNVYISSMTPATVYINGREMKMSAADIATMLKSLPPNTIEKIEILRTPSSKYDASSSGGIVNVVLKKGVKIGTTGSVNSGMQQGKYGNQFAGFNINNNNGERSSFLNLNYSHRDTYEQIRTDRLFAPDSILKQDALTRYPGSTYFIGYGMVVPSGKKWETDFGTSLSINDYKNSTVNNSTISKISTGQVLTDNRNDVENDGNSVNFRSGISGKLKLDSLGSEWVNDVFYNFTRNKSEQVFSTTFFTPAGYITNGDGQSVNKRNQVNLQSDLKWKMKKRLTIETGIKASFLTFNSVTNYYKAVNGSRMKDAGRTNTFDYKENINAGYLQGSKSLGKDFVIKGGFRIENTNMKGQQLIPDDTSFIIHRTDIFPYLYISKKLLSIAGFDLRGYLVYRRTISRPVYEQLNPFPRYVDQYLSETGNPSLRPQFTTNYEANISVDERPILAVGYNDTKDIFTNVIYQADSTQSQAYRTYDNLGKNREWYFRGLGAIPPGKKYFFVLGAQYNYMMYDGLYENKPLTFQKGTWTFFTYHQLKLGARSQLTMNGFVRFKGQQQLYELSSFGALNTSINRRFLKEKLTITFSVMDIFGTNRNEFTIDQGSVHASGLRRGDTRRAGINLRYNFGIRKKEENNNMFNIDLPEKTN